MHTSFATKDPADLTGHEVEDYRILSCVTRGGMSDVYIAEARDYPSPVVLKFERSDDRYPAHFRSRFGREISIHSKIRTNAVPRFLRAGRIFGRRFIAMERIEGRDLGYIILPRTKPSTPPDTEQFVDICIKAFIALGKLSNEGIIHRDIKPANVLICDNGGVKICDLGIATFSRCEPFTEENHILGTVGYMSPEQWDAQVLDARTDIYSMGLTMLEYMTGMTVVKRQEYGIGHRPDFLIPDDLFIELEDRHPPRLLSIIRQCLRYDRRLRYQSPQRVAEDLLVVRERLMSTKNLIDNGSDIAPVVFRIRWTDILIAVIFLTMAFLAFFI